MKSKIEKRSINFLPNAKLTAAGKTRDFFQMKNIWANVLFRMLRTSEKHNLAGTTYIDTTLRSLQLCPGIILLWFNDAQRAAPNINCEPGAPWPTSSTTSA